MQFSVGTLRSFVGRLGREARLAADIALSGRKTPCVLFLPSHGNEMSSALRVYNIASALRAFGWRTHVVPKQLNAHQRSRMISLARPDVVVVQKSRHHLNRMKYLGGLRFVYDLDDADFFDEQLAPEMEKAVSASIGCICGSRFVADWARRFSPNVEVIWTGNPISAGPWPEHSAREPIVAWAQSAPLQYGREFEFVRHICLALAQRDLRFRLRLYGWPSGVESEHVSALREVGIEVQLLPPMPYREFMLSLREVAVGLSPIIAESAFSRGKSFGKVLGYLDAKVPVVCSDQGEHSAFFDEASGVVTNDFDHWVDAVERLVRSPDERSRLSERAHARYREMLSIETAAHRVDAFLRRTLLSETVAMDPQSIVKQAI